MRIAAISSTLHASNMWHISHRRLFECVKKGLYACELIYIYTLPNYYIYIVYDNPYTNIVFPLYIYIGSLGFGFEHQICLQIFVMFYGPWGRGSLGLGFEHQICLQDLSCFTAFGAAVTHTFGNKNFD